MFSRETSPLRPAHAFRGKTHQARPLWWANMSCPDCPDPWVRGEVADTRHGCLKGKGRLVYALFLNSGQCNQAYHPCSGLLLDGPAAPSVWWWSWWSWWWWWWWWWRWWWWWWWWSFGPPQLMFIMWGLDSSQVIRSKSWLQASEVLLAADWWPLFPQVFMDNHDTQRGGACGANLTYKNGALYTLANAARRWMARWRRSEIGEIGLLRHWGSTEGKLQKFGPEQS